MAPTAANRRVRNGLILGVAVPVAIALCVLLNWLTYRQYRSMSPDARQWVRYDLTSTRRYSLSEQTRSVIGTLTEQHKIVTMLGRPDETDLQKQRVQEVRDLVDEYSRASAFVEASHLDLTGDLDRRATLLADLAEQYSGDTAAIRRAVLIGDTDAEAFAKELEELQGVLQGVIDSGVITRSGDIQALYDLNAQFLQVLKQHEEYLAIRSEQLGTARWQERLAGKRWEGLLDQWRAVPPNYTDPGSDGLRQAGESDGVPLPDYELLLVHLQQFYLAVDRQVAVTTSGVVDAVVRRVASPGQSASPEERQRSMEARNSLALLSQRVSPPRGAAPSMHDRLRVAIRPVVQLELPQRYNDARAIVSDQPCIVIMSEDQARVVPSALLYRGTGGEEIVGDTTAQEQFLGEEQLTGAMISMTLDPPPLVVFVRSNLGRSALTVGSGENTTHGDYNHVAQRLRSLGFEVVDWAPQVQAPIPKPGQKVVWVTMPYAQPIPGQPVTMDQALKARVMNYVRQRLDEGDSALVILAANRFADPERASELLAMPGIDDAGLAGDPITELLAQWGIEAQIYQNVLRVVSEDDEGRPIAPAHSSFTVTTWPEDGTVGNALSGIATYFREAYPLFTHETPGITHRPLVALDHSGMWVQKTLPSERDGQPMTIPNDAKVERLTIGVSAQRGASRLIAVGDPWWAMDAFTTYGTTPDGRQGPGLAEEPGAFINYPGNSELFVNSILWLTEQDALIAASPRTQDIRRIPEMDPSRLRVYKVLLLGVMPGAILIMAIAVGLVRRRA